MKTTIAIRAGQTSNGAGKTTVPIKNAGRKSRNTTVTVELCPIMWGIFSAAAKEHECTVGEAVQLLIDRADAPIDWQNEGFAIN